eukprot:CAMPEP_0198548808 /NCGR_PEP_ID=MMETSP1462-20131121/71053_1 /TAXON_ID=1333877 /ORGANISM="Brandtodinium nutriculum, Strain RCC3387" /LENGTH=34 /DNA_ID= /DNA_START= /DNA_END= /DNA_ORIENTATION=
MGAFGVELGDQHRGNAADDLVGQGPRHRNHDASA